MPNPIFLALPSFIQFNFTIFHLVYYHFAVNGSTNVGTVSSFHQATIPNLLSIKLQPTKSPFWSALFSRKNNANKSIDLENTTTTYHYQKPTILAYTRSSEANFSEVFQIIRSISEPIAVTSSYVVTGLFCN